MGIGAFATTYPSSMSSITHGATCWDEPSSVVLTWTCTSGSNQPSPRTTTSPIGHPFAVRPRLRLYVSSPSFFRLYSPVVSYEPAERSPRTVVVVNATRRRNLIETRHRVEESISESVQ